MILGLHGFRQNGTVLSDKLARLGLTVTCPDGPLVVEASENLRGWWRLDVTPPETVRQHIQTPHSYEGFAASLSYLQATVPLGEVRTVVGFSQGAVLATLLLLQGHLPRVTHVLLFSGSDIMDMSLVDETTHISARALCFHGEQDALVPPEAALKLSRRYHQAEIQMHRQGHVIPSASAIKRKIAQFLGEEK